MNVTLEFTEVEADFIAQAIDNELRMALLMNDNPMLTTEQHRNVGFRIENLQQILQKLVNS